MNDNNNTKNNNGIVAIPPVVAPIRVPVADSGPLDKVKPPTEKKRSREWER